MPRNRRQTAALSDSESEQAKDSNELLTTILKEVREIKKQNDKLREETKKELEEIRTELQRRDDKWENDRNKIQDKICKVETETENKIKRIDTRLQELAKAEEKRQRQERKNNIIIKNAETGETKNNTVQQEVNKIFSTMEIDVNYEQARYIGKDWRGRNMFLVQMKNFEHKLRVMKNKKKLIGKECFIENDLTKEERQVQSAIRRRAKEEREKGHTVKIGYRKIQINGKWEYYNNEEPKNEQWKGAETTENQRRRTI